ETRSSVRPEGMRPTCRCTRRTLSRSSIGVHRRCSRIWSYALLVHQYANSLFDIESGDAASRIESDFREIRFRISERSFMDTAYVMTSPTRRREPDASFAIMNIVAPLQASTLYDSRQFS